MNTDAKAVVLPDGCTGIGSRAFADCTDIVSVYMPDSVTSFAADAFDGSANVSFVCKSENAAAAFAAKNGIYYTVK